MLTPRPHLSWSQLNLFETSPDQYREIYLNGKQIPINRGMALGKEVADALESNEETGDIIKDLVIAQLPKMDWMDYEFKAVVSIGDIEIPLLSKFDSVNKEMTALYEYKTGSTPWNQKKADKHGQITFYCVLIQAMTGKIPEDIELIWAPTEKKDDGKVELTGEILRFKTKRTTADILKMKIRMKNVWLDIKKLVEKELF